MLGETVIPDAEGDPPNRVSKSRLRARVSAAAGAGGAESGRDLKGHIENTARNRFGIVLRLFCAPPGDTRGLGSVP